MASFSFMQSRFDNDADALASSSRSAQRAYSLLSAQCCDRVHHEIDMCKHAVKASEMPKWALKMASYVMAFITYAIGFYVLLCTFLWLVVGADIL